MRRDVIIIGGGHNGLVAAWYLARAGCRVLILERHGEVGGAAVTEEFHPGFRNSVASYTLGLLDPSIARDMALARHGLAVIERPFANFLPLGKDDYLLVGGGRTAEQVARFSSRDAAMLPEYERRLDTVAGLLRHLAGRIPPNAGGGPADLFRAIGQARAFLKLGIEAERDAVDLFTRSAREFLDGFFESAPIKAALGFDAVVGNFASPDTPGSAYVLLHHVFGEVNGKPGQWGHAVGGMGAVTQAMKRACIEAGVTIRTDAEVAEVLVAAGRVTGVRLAGGETIAGNCVAANCHPRTLLLDLVDPVHIDAATRQRMTRHANGSGTFRMNVALDRLPRFTCLPEPGDHLKSGIILAPSLDYMDRAFADTKVLGWSREPIVEMLIPSLVDDSLAPPGKHVASLFCQHFAYTLPGNRNWRDAKTEAVEAILATVERLAPGFRESVIGHVAYSPPDLERRFGLVGGDIFHGRMSLDQLWAARPLLGLASHRMPVKGLFLCGSGAHPGGGVTGRPGRNAAAAILARHG